MENPLPGCYNLFMESDTPLRISLCKAIYMRTKFSKKIDKNTGGTKMKKKLVALLLSGAMVTGLFTCTVVVNAETNTAAEEEEAEESGSVLDEIFSEDGLIGRLTDGKAGVILKSAAEELTK